MNNITPFTLHFSEISAADLPRVGGKGANLGEMARAGFPIPPGFCVTTAGFQAFIDTAPAMGAFYERLADLTSDDVEGVRALGSELRAYLAERPVPEDIAAEVLAAWQALDPDAAFAVRSSATAEDLPSASFAGQQDTYLNVRGAEKILEKVRGCWVSLFTDRAILYRAQKGFDHRQVQLSVVVQQMVFPEASGILFTADPVSGHRGILTIDASYGLGEALVAGLVTPDLYKVDKRTWEVIEARVADKRLAIWPSEEGGTHQEELDETRRYARVLPDSQALELARIAARIEAHYGTPQDIEWALVGDTFTILQSRPITSLYPLPPNDGAYRVYFSLSHAQVMTDVMSPLGISIWKLLVPFGRPDGSSEYNKYLQGAGGRMYFDLSPLLNTKIGRRAIPRALQVADELSGMALKELVERPDFLERAEASEERATFRGVMSWLGPLVPRALLRLWFARPETAVPLLDRHIAERVQVAADAISAAAPGLPRLRAAYEYTAITFNTHARPLIPFVMTAMMSSTLLQRLAKDAADPADLTAVFSGLEGNVTLNMDLEVGDLAAIALAHPAVVDLLQGGAPGVTLERLPEVDGGPEFLAELEKFLGKYGMRGPSEIDIARDRWSDNPGSLFQMVLGSLGSARDGGHRARHQKLVAEGEAAVDRFAEAVRKTRGGWLKSRVARRMARVYRAHMPIREHPKYMLVQMIDRVRRVLLDAARELVEHGRMDRVEDIWLLEFHEVLEAFELPERDLSPLLKERRTAQAHYEGLKPPRLFTSEGEQIRGRYSLENLPPGAVPGSAVSGGVVEGIARVVTDPTTEVLNPGEILIAPFTDPGWTPLFINAAGLVMETGGLMTHGSVVAREYGIPAVVGVEAATKIFKTGQRVRVDGNRGVIEVVESLRDP